MSNLNWSTAPIDATHGGNSPYERGVVTWFKDVGNGNHSFLNDGSMQSWHKGSGNLSQWSLVERPKPWSGPEDGLPPVGVECEYGANEKWFPVKVIAHQSGGFYLEPQAVSQIPENGPLCIGTAKHFRAIKTAEQLAADNRETAIRELMDIAQVDCRVTAGRLVDAGFKREVA